MLSFHRDGTFILEIPSSGSTTMKQMGIHGTAPFLPEEIINNILKWLPVKSLMRFQCVCKHWKNLFKNPSFIADHLHHSSNQNPSFMFFQNYGSDPLHLRLIDCEMQIRDVQKAPPFNSLQCAFVNIIGSSNGLLCVTLRHPVMHHPRPLLLWNPATRDLREVPRSRTFDSRGYICVFGFGFSSFDNDYKIVTTYAYYDGRICGAEVYSLSRNSWKEIEFENLEDVTLSRENVSSNGAIFWYGFKPGKEEEEEEEDGVIVSFDIRMEVFTLIPWPALSNNPCFKLTVYGDKLAMLTEHGIVSSNIDLWVLGEDIVSSGERWTWTKKFTCSHFPWELSPGTVWRNEIVMSGTEIEWEIENNEPKSDICLFNVTTNEFKMLAIPQYRPSCGFLNYVESLVPVVNINNIEEP